MREEWSHAHYGPTNGKLLYVNAKTLHPDYTVSDRKKTQGEKQYCAPGSSFLTKVCCRSHMSSVCRFHRCCVRGADVQVWVREWMRMCVFMCLRGELG